MLEKFFILLPEIALTMIAIKMQLYAVFFPKNGQKTVSIIIGLICALLVYIVLFNHSEGNIGDYFVASNMSNGIKAIILVLSLMAIVIYRNLVLINHDEVQIEFITLILLATVGSFISISSRDFLLLFCGLELQSLASYALAAFDSKKLKSTEAGLKYFILGSLVSCLLLFGISFLYGFSGTIIFDGIRDMIELNNNIALTIGMILVLAAILFKLSVAPMHIWTPDVYEGSPISAVTFFASSQKLGMLIVLFNILAIIPVNLSVLSKDLIKITAILSMFVGALGAIRQTSLKRLMAYSTILNMGFVLIGVCLNNSEGKEAALIYMIIYVISVIGFFSCLVALFGAKADEASFDDLSNIAHNRKTLALAISIIMFSMIGIPPFAGFFGKYILFLNAIKQGEIILAVIGVITSVIAAYYYLKVVKYIYFIPSQKSKDLDIIPTYSGLLYVSVSVIGFIVLFFFLAQLYIIL